MQIESGPRFSLGTGGNGRLPIRILVTVLAACVAVLLAGCAAAAPTPLDGPSAPAPFTLQGWSYRSDPGWCLTSTHYRLFTTLNDAEINKSVIQVMEAALGEYQKIAPGVPISDRPMDCFLFGSRQQWTDFTRRHTGIDARIYLQITRGGYTVRDWYVAYFVGEAATYSVAAHEGWHQFVFRNFKGRLPPFLEEGIATMFEDIHWHHDLPQWNLAINRSRVSELRRAVEGHDLYPLDQLMTMHAGNVVNQSGAHIEAFYAQCWAFAAFLWSGDGGKYRVAMRQLMSDTADGSVFDPSGAFADARRPWNPAGVRPMLEHYLGMKLQTIDSAYQRFIQHVAFDNYGSEFD